MSPSPIATLFLHSSLVYLHYVLGVQLPIENPSFEEDGYPISSNIISNWNSYDPGELLVEESVTIGVQNTTYNDTIFRSNGSSGNQSAYIYVHNKSGDYEVGIEQLLTDQYVKPNVVYSLSAWIGNADAPFPGYKVQLLAHDAILAQDNNTLNISKRTWKKTIVTATISPQNANIGTALKIRLINTNDGTAPNKVAFDDVQLEATALVTSTPRMLSCDERTHGLYENNTLEFHIQMPYNGTITFIFKSDFNVTGLSSIFASDDNNITDSLASADDHNEAILTVHGVQKKSECIFIVQASRGAYGSFNASVVCEPDPRVSSPYPIGTTSVHNTFSTVQSKERNNNSVWKSVLITIFIVCVVSGAVMVFCIFYKKKATTEKTKYSKDGPESSQKKHQMHVGLPKLNEVRPWSGHVVQVRDARKNELQQPQNLNSMVKLEEKQSFKEEANDIMESIELKHALSSAEYKGNPQIKSLSSNTSMRWMNSLISQMDPTEYDMDILVPSKKYTLKKDSIGEARDDEPENEEIDSWESTPKINKDLDISAFSQYL